MLGAASTGLYITSAAWLSKRVVDSLIGADGGGVSSAMLFASLYALATLLHAIVGSYYAVRLLTIRDRFVSVADQLLMDKVASAWSLASVELPSARDRIRLASAGARSLPSVVSNSVRGGTACHHRARGCASSSGIFIRSSRCWCWCRRCRCSGASFASTRRRSPRWSTRAPRIAACATSSS